MPPRFDPAYKFVAYILNLILEIVLSIAFFLFVLLPLDWLLGYIEAFKPILLLTLYELPCSPQGQWLLSLPL